MSRRETARRARALLLAAGLAASLGGGSARAQPAPKENEPTESQLQQARAAFEQGQAYFENKVYDKAVESYRTAYELAHYPELLLNIAQSYRLMGEEENALAAYKEFIELEPKHQYADDVRGYIASLTRTLRERKAKEAREPPAVEDTGPATPPSAPPEKANDEAITAVRVIGLRTEKAGRHLRIAGITAVALGAVAVGVGVKFAFDVQKIEDELSMHEGPWTDATLARAGDGDRAERNMIIAFGLGAGAIVTGGVLYVLGHSVASAPDATVRGGLSLVPRISPAGFALGLEGAF